MSLDLDTIQELLKEQPRTRTSSDKGSTGVVREKPVQLGPLHWHDSDGRCASRGCSGPTRIRVEGIPYCSTHALYALNYMLIQIHSDYEDVSYTKADCTCNAGKHSMMNIHGPDCILYERIKEHRVNSSRESA